MNKSMKILVVDDFMTMRRITRKFLIEFGFENIIEADDGLTALPLLRENDVDFLITDWNMPGMSGLDLLRTVRADEQLATLPVLMVTSEARENQIKQAADAGVNGYLVKPFTKEILQAQLDQVFGRLAVA